MPSLSVIVSQSSHDGHASWSDRDSSTATNFTATQQTWLGCHFTAGNVYSRFFIFRFGDGSIGSGLPQGVQIDEAKLEIRFNNGAPGGSLHDHAYICVENNLDPTGTGAIVNGTLGSQAWQRLGRQTAATTLLGARCGPTHTGNLATTGRGVRESQALVYKAFADARNIPDGTWQETDDFAGALQALVNDPGWNPNSQYVMIHMFSDHRVSAGTTGGVGYLGGITWASGQTGTASEGNGPAAQIYNIDHNLGIYTPKLNIEYTNTSLLSHGGGAISSGNIRLQPSICLGRQRGERAEDLSGNGILPIQTGGAHDLPFTGMVGVLNPNNPLEWQDGSGFGARIKWANQRPGRVDGKSIWFEDYADRSPRIWWDIGKYQSYYTTRKIYSLRFYHRFDQEGWLGYDHNVVSFRLNDVESFRVFLRGKHFTFPDPVKEGELGIRWPGMVGNIWGTYEFKPPSSQGFYRYEIQVDDNSNPKVRVRVYLNDSTTPLDSLTANPPNVEIDRVTFGDYYTDGGLFNQKLADVEIWSDYLMNREYPNNLDNLVGSPYKPQKWTWFEYDGGFESRQLEDLGTIDSIDLDGQNPVITFPNDSLNLEDGKGEVWNGGSASFTKYTDLSYGTGSGRRLDLYVPNGTPPEGGWPIIMYTHGGFWIAGNKGLISSNLVTDCTLRGYAVASCSYVLAGLYFVGLGQAYPAWNPSSATGRYPSFTINYKEAAHWLKTEGATTYNLNPNKIVATGHSAGGYNALSAVITKGLTNDGAGRNLTLAGNTATFGSPNVADPDFLGAYSFAAPVNLSELRNWDPTHPNWPAFGLGVGILHATCRFFMGDRVDQGSGGNVNNVNLDQFVILNAPNISSVCYAWGTGDHLVISAPFSQYSQSQLLANAFEFVSGSLPSGTTFTNHEIPDAMHHTIQAEDLDYEHFFRWLKNLPGL